MFGGAGGVLAAAGNGGFAGAVVAGGAPAATVSPGVAVAGVVLLADDSSLVEVSTMQTLRQTELHTSALHRVKIIQLPALQGSLSAQEQIIRLFIKSAVPINTYNGARC